MPSYRFFDPARAVVAAVFFGVAKWSGSDGESERRAWYDGMVFIELRVVVVVGAALVADTLLVVLLICLCCF